MPKPGCGTIIAFIIIFLVIFSIGSNEAIGYYFTHCDDEDILHCLLGVLDEEPESEPEPGTVVAVGEYSYKDYPVTVTMNIPLDGGAVTGSMTGTCDGNVKGNFGGQQNGVISGTITGTCDPFFVKIPASADFSGAVNKTDKTVPIHFTGRGGGIEHEGSMWLNYK